MGFYLKKSLNAGPVKFNLSQSGVGASVGVKGLRVGKGTRGNYVHMGRQGVYYRTALKSAANKDPDVVADDSAVMTDATSMDLVDEISRKLKRISIFPFSIFILPVMLYFKHSLVVSIAATIVSGLLLYLLFDKGRRDVSLFYDVDEEFEQKLSRYYDSFERVIGCTPYRAEHRDNKKYYSGVYWKIPKHIYTNVNVPCISADGVSFYFFPDKLLIYSGKEVGAIDYTNLNIKAYNKDIATNRYSTDDPGAVVGKTWQYTTKAGQPDKRYKNNPQVPIIKFSLLELSTSNYKATIILSKPDVGNDIAKGFDKYMKREKTL